MSNIQTAIPPLTLTVSQTQTLLVTPIILPPGRAISDYQTFTVTIRADPNYPRQTAAAILQANYADPIAEGWSVAYTGSGTGSVVAGQNQAAFPIASTVELQSGPQRYSCVVWGMSSLWGQVQLLTETWLSCLPG